MTVKPIEFTDGRLRKIYEDDLWGVLYKWNRSFGSSLTLIIIKIGDDDDV
jgi:hypothetical protein